MARRNRNYTVRRGDTVATISKQLGIDPQTLMRVNTGVDNLRPGMVLKTPTQSDGVSPFLPPSSVYPLDKIGGVMAQAGGELPYPPAPQATATQPIAAYTEPAGQPRYQTVTVAEQLANGVPDENMEYYGFVKRGNSWIRSTEGLDTAGVAAPGYVEPWKERGREIQRVEDMHGYPGQRVFEVERQSSPSAPGDQTYTAIKRYDAYGNLSSIAPAVANRPRLAHNPAPIGQRRRYGGNLLGVGLSMADAKDIAKWKKWKREEKLKGDEEVERRGVGHGAQSYQPYGSSGGGSRTPSVRQYARPNYLGLINWRI